MAKTYEGANGKYDSNQTKYDPLDPKWYLDSPVKSDDLDPSVCRSPLSKDPVDDNNPVPAGEHCVDPGVRSEELDSGSDTDCVSPGPGATVNMEGRDSPRVADSTKYDTQVTQQPVFPEQDAYL